MFDDMTESFKPKKNVESHNFVEIKKILDQNRFNMFVKCLLAERSEKQGIQMTDEKKFELL